MRIPIVPDFGSLGFASIDVDMYSSAKSTLQLPVEAKTETLLPVVELQFDDVWSEWGYSRFAGELLEINEINEQYAARKVDCDRYVDYWHGTHRPWHAAMYLLHVFDHPGRFNPSKQDKRVIA